MRIDPRNVPAEWIRFPDFIIYPPQRHNATVWIIGHTISYITHSDTLSLQDYLDFLRRSRWKAQNSNDQYKHYGRYLEILEQG
jgi:hypothetical protein